jgi:hypothetical protein
MTSPEIAALLKTRMPDAAQRVSTKVLPNCVMRLGRVGEPIAAGSGAAPGHFQERFERESQGRAGMGAAV